MPEPESVSPADIAPSGPPPIPTEPQPPQPAPSEGATAANGTQAGSTPAPVSTAGDVKPGDLDKRGTPFDPARHVAKTHPTTGAWLPRGGRKRGVSGAMPGQKPSAPPPPSFIPRDVPPPAAPGATADGAAKPAEPEGVDCSEDAGETFAHGIQFLTGIVLDAFEDAECSPAEHKRMAAALASYFRAIGWRAAAGLGLVLVLVGYFLRTFKREKPRAKFRQWIHGAAPAPEPKNVTPPPARPATPTPPQPPREPSVFDLVPFPTQQK